MLTISIGQKRRQSFEAYFRSPVVFVDQSDRAPRELDAIDAADVRRRHLGCHTAGAFFAGAAWLSDRSWPQRQPPVTIKARSRYRATLWRDFSGPLARQWFFLPAFRQEHDLPHVLHVRSRRRAITAASERVGSGRSSRRSTGGLKRQTNWSTRVPCPGGSGGNDGGLYALASSLASLLLFTSDVLSEVFSGAFSGVLDTTGLTGAVGVELATVEMLMVWIPGCISSTLTGRNPTRGESIA
jgi:hypothetical protein